MRSTLVLVALASCSGDRSPGIEHPAFGKKVSEPLMAEVAKPAPPPDRNIDIPKPDPKETGLKFVAKPAAKQAPKPAPPAAIEPLSQGDIEALLARLPPIRTEAEDVKSFALREGPKPPERTGATVQAKFPPPSSDLDRPSVAEPPLEVLRVQPQGDVAIAGHLAITFSQPMVKVETDDAIQSAAVPVKLTPQPEGQWRWAGTRTLLFEAKPRFPMATEYTVTIPAGVTSALGTKLQEPRTFRFTTPPPRVEAFVPTGEGHPLDPLLMIGFDQKIDPSAVLKTVVATVNGKKIDLVLSPERAAKEMPGYAKSDRHVIFQAARPFAKDTLVKVAIGPGTPSAEGPLVTKQKVENSFRTYGPLRFVSQDCSWDQECYPDSRLQLHFNNALAEPSYRDGPPRPHPSGEEDPSTLVSIAPKPDELKIDFDVDGIGVSGKLLPEAQYTVTVGAGLTDIHGQKLGRPKTAVFRMSKMRPFLSAPGELFVVLEPAALKKPSLPIYSVRQPQVHLRMYRVAPEDWFQYLRWVEDHDGSEKVAPPGKKVADRMISTKPNGLAVTPIDLAPALDHGRGNAVIEVEGTTKLRRWVQATEIGLDASIDHEDLYAFATTLLEGKPLSGVELTLIPSGPKAKGDATGFARMSLPGSGEQSSSILVARNGDQIAFLPETKWHSNGTSWVKQRQRDGFRVFLFDDRGLYRPGETVHFKGWIRELTGGKAGDVAPIDGGGTTVDFLVRDSRGTEIKKGTAPLTALGGFTFSADLPKNVNLGWGRAEIRTKIRGDQVDGSYAFQVEEFRRPEFEVNAEASEGPHLVGQWAELEVGAAYYSGGPLGGAAVRWELRAQPASYAPPDREEYSFGIWTPWWGHYDFIERDVGETAQQLEGFTGPDGTHRVRVELLGANPPRAMALTGHASVMDVNRQAWAADATLLVHPASVYVGIKPARAFVVINEKIAVDVIRVDLDGKIAPGKVRVSAAPLWVSDPPVAEECGRDIARDEPVSCEFVATAGGPWRITASSTDERGRPTRSERVIWVAGGPAPRDQKVEQQKVELIPDHDTYAIGDTAEIMVRTPFAPAEALVTLRRQGILRAERISLPQGSAVVKVPIEEAHLPNLTVQVDAVGTADGKPAYATMSLGLRIPPVARTLTLDLVPEEPIVEPGAKTAVQLRVIDAKGAAVAGAEATVFVVDEAVLALARYETPNPIPTFYPARGEGATDLHLRDDIVIPAPPSAEMTRRMMRLERFAAEGKMKKAEMEMEEPPAPPPPPPPGQQIRVRTNFSPLAVFAPEVKTDKEGRARVEIDMPDNLTRYRIMAVAVAGAKFFGSAESSVTAKKALMVRPSPPRFLNFGDRFELAMVVQNQTNREVPTAVFVRATNATIEDQRDGGGGARPDKKAQGVLVRVPPQERALVSFPARAAKPGTARFQFGIAAGGFDDAAELSLPVWTPATTEAFATYGELDRGAMRQPIGVPANVEPSFGALELSTSSTQLQALTDAFIYLVDYPYGCSEQISSRVLSIAALKDVLAAFEAEGLPPAAELEAHVAADVKRLGEIQNWDGGWGLWNKGERSWPFTAIHVMHALIRAREKGFAIPEQMLANGHRYLRSIEEHIPKEYPASVHQAIQAYALYVRALMGDIDQNQASAVIERAGGIAKMPLEILGWLYPVLADSNKQGELAELRRAIDNAATETAGAAHFATGYGEGGAYLIMHSDRRVDALLLEGLIRDQPQHTLIPKIVRGLLAHRTKGRWSNTQENAWVLLALDRYFRTYEKITPDFVARAWLGDQFAGEHAFRGRTTERHQIDIPMSFLLESKAQDLFVTKEGEGRLYYRIGLRYAPADLLLSAKNRGFEVERKYEAIDDPSDVSRAADGTWTIKAGARVRVVITMTAPGRRYHVALIDPLPAGLEPMNPALGMSDVPDEARPWWMWRWYEHQNLRDERAEAFTSLLEGGVHGWGYVARATTVGSFVAPPAHAEEMYAPETFGRSKTDRVIVRSDSSVPPR